MKKFFNPEEYGSYQELPEDKKPEFKPVDSEDGAFVKETVIENE